jgi:hypothetical protein
VLGGNETPAKDKTRDGFPRCRLTQGQSRCLFAARFFASPLLPLVTSTRHGFFVFVFCRLLGFAGFAGFAVLWFRRVAVLPCYSWVGRLLILLPPACWQSSWTWARRQSTRIVASLRGFVGLLHQSLQSQRREACGGRPSFNYFITFRPLSVPLCCLVLERDPTVRTPMLRRSTEKEKEMKPHEDAHSTPRPRHHHGQNFPSASHAESFLFSSACVRSEFQHCFVFLVRFPILLARQRKNRSASFRRRFPPPDGLQPQHSDTMSISCQRKGLLSPFMRTSPVRRLQSSFRTEVPGLGHRRVLFSWISSLLLPRPDSGPGFHRSRTPWKFDKCAKLSAYRDLDLVPARASVMP